jgi:hypothetical protein
MEPTGQGLPPLGDQVLRQLLQDRFVHGAIPAVVVVKVLGGDINDRLDLLPVGPHRSENEPPAPHTAGTNHPHEECLLEAQLSVSDLDLGHLPGSVGGLLAASGADGQSTCRNAASRAEHGSLPLVTQPQRAPAPDANRMSQPGRNGEPPEHRRRHGSRENRNLRLDNAERTLGACLGRPDLTIIDCKGVG